MNLNRTIVNLSIVICILIIAIPTVYKVINENHRKLYIVTNKMVIEAAQKCFYEDKCADTRITLKELYTHGYLTDKVIDPVTKVVYADDSYVLLKKEDAVFNPL